MSDFDIDVEQVSKPKRKPPVAAAKEGARKAIAKASGKAAAAAPARAPIPRTEAPEGFKAAMYVFTFACGADGMVDPTTWSVTRIQGKIDNPKAKRNDLAEFDLCSSLGLISRLSAVLFQTNMEKRLQITPEGREYTVTCRLGRRAADNTLIFSIKTIQYRRKNKLVLIEDKTDPTYRRIRRMARLATSGFVAVALPPRAKRVSKRQQVLEENEVMDGDEY